MFKRYRRSAFILLLLLSILLSACGQSQNSAADTASGTGDVATDNSDDAIVLRIVTEETEPFMMNDITQELIEAYQETHENVTFELEILPTDETEREFRLKTLRTEIMSGKGPDIFLMPTNTRYIRQELLVKDVTQSMYSGIFADISQLYNADVELKAEELQSSVMDAGTIGDARYILPLYYNIDTILIDKEVFAQYGVSEEEITGSFDDLYNTILEKNEPMLARSANMYLAWGTRPFSQLINYENGEVLVTPEEIADHFRIFQQWAKLQSTAERPIDGPFEVPSLITNYSITGSFWQIDGDSMEIDPLINALQSFALNKATNEGDVVAYPLRSSDGSLSAEVTYWGAIGAGCEHIDIAYDFLRQFLSEEVQWETEKSERLIGAAHSLYVNGYPVRIKGSVTPATRYVINLAYNATDIDTGSPDRWRTVEPVKLIESDFPILDAEIDYVRFPLSWEVDFWFARKDLVDFFNGCQPADVDVDEVAKELHQQLVYHVAES